MDKLRNQLLSVTRQSIGFLHLFDGLRNSAATGSAFSRVLENGLENLDLSSEELSTQKLKQLYC